MEAIVLENLGNTSYLLPLGVRALEKKEDSKNVSKRYKLDQSLIFSHNKNVYYWLVRISKKKNYSIAYFFSGCCHVLSNASLGLIVPCFIWGDVCLVTTGEVGHKNWDTYFSASNDGATCIFSIMCERVYMYILIATYFSFRAFPFF